MAQVNENQYPYWFLYQGELKCSSCAVGYAAASIYPDSAFAQAYFNAVLNYSRLKNLTIAGSQSFWSTEVGTAWMGNNFVEQFDSSIMLDSKVKFTILDKFNSGNIVLVLVGARDSKTEIQLESGIISNDVSSPYWVDSLPKDLRYFYSVGVAPEYFYETSSWLEAESSARRNLARSQFVRMKALQKYTKGDDQEVRTEEISFTLKNVEVVSRWRDVKNKIFYVLIRNRILGE